MSKTALEAMTCPNCGGDVQLDENQEYGFCKYCGTKVQNSNFKRVQLKGKVQIDNSEFVKKFLANARRARDKEDWEEAEKYYDLVEQNEPNNMEAIFYSAYGKLRTTILEDYSNKWLNSFQVLKKSISVLDDHFDMENEEKEKEIIKRAVKDILSLQNAANNPNIILGRILSEQTLWTPADVVAKETKKLYPELDVTLNNIISKYKNANYDYGYLEELKEEIKKASSKGCYVATCVYGSYDCPQVWTLRRYRDYKLGKTWYGKIFIHIYYTISPKIVKIFGKQEWFKRIWKNKLDKMVKKLQEKGYKSAPYNDIDW